MGKPNRTQSETALQRPRETLGMGLAGRQPPLPNKTQTMVQTTGATSRIGLKVTYAVLDKAYELKRQASDRFLQSYPIRFEKFLPDWNYTVAPTDY